MTTDINELVKRLRDGWSGSLRHAAADALEAMAGEVERLKVHREAVAETCALGFSEFERVKAERDRLAGEVENLKHDIARHMTIANEAAAERDRLKAALDALEAVRSDLPKKVSEQWLYEGVRHWHRNCDWDDPRDGSPLDRGDGATVAKILNMIPRKALGGDAS